MDDFEDSSLDHETDFDNVEEKGHTEGEGDWGDTDEASIDSDDTKEGEFDDLEEGDDEDDEFDDEDEDGDDENYF